MRGKNMANKKLEESSKEESNEKDNQKGNKPVYTSDGVAVWVNMSKKGEPYLAIRIVGHNTIYAYKTKE